MKELSWLFVFWLFKDFFLLIETKILDSCYHLVEKNVSLAYIQDKLKQF